MKRNSIFLLVTLVLVSSCAKKQRKYAESQLPTGPGGQTAGKSGAESEPGKVKTCEVSTRKITILGTNDIHGNLEGKSVYVDNDSGVSKVAGGMALFAGVVKSAREKSDGCNGVIVLDGGDQFQGTLISNYNEGLLMGQAMREVGYDAIVPGNHDYDFGPIGWENDSVQHAEEAKLSSLERFSIQTQRKLKSAALSMEGSTDGSSEVSPRDPKATIIQFKNALGSPLLSANTYQIESLKDSAGNLVKVDSVGCRPVESERKIDWSLAKRPEFLGSHVIKDVAGLKIAIIGLDIANTASITTKANVSDLCFRDPVEEFLSLQKELRQTVDMTVVVAHFGNPAGAKVNREAAVETKVSDSITITEFLDRVLTDKSCVDQRCIDAIVGGHTHQTNEIVISGVPAIQSGSNAQRYGRIDLTYDASKKQVDRSKTQLVAGRYFFEDTCSKGTEGFCGVSENGRVLLDGIPLVSSEKLTALIKDEKRKVEAIAGRVLGIARGDLSPSRADESALGNKLSDTLLLTGQQLDRDPTMKATVAFLNSGGIRNPLKMGPITYSNFYEVQPFNNRAVIIPNFKVSDLIVLVKKTIQTCGKFGGMNFSGIRVQFRKDCKSDVNKATQEDLSAELIKVETDDGEVLYDGSLKASKQISLDKVLKVVTLDFLAEGGSGYGAAFRPEHKRIVIAGPYRENFVKYWLSTPFEWDNKRDNRMDNLN